ncbi:hypothetical protein ACERNI_03255 [Camelimonas sp. ID_303_24]
MDRAIRGLSDNTPDARNALFARARDVLLAQLRGMDPPLPEADVAHEMAALDDVIARIEREQVAEGKGGQPAAPVAPPTAPPVAAPASSPQPPAPAAGQNPPPSQGSAPQVAAPPAGGATLSAAPANLAPANPPPSSATPSSASPSSAPLGAAATPTARDSSAPAAGAAVSGAGAAPGAAPKPATQLGHTGIRPANGAPQGGAQGMAPAAAPKATPSRETPVLEPVADDARLRPPPQKPAGKGRRNALIGGLLAIALVGVGGVAYWANKVKQPAPPPAETPVAAAPDAGNDQKFGQRVDAGRAQTGQQGGAAQPGQAVEGVQRAILYEETPDNPQTPKVFQGKVTWRLDSENPGQNQPLENVVRADVTIPEAGLDLKITLRRNTDAALPASHLMELTFRKGATGDGRVIRDIGVPQFKTEENARGVPLAGLPVAVSESVFLVGLSNLPNDIERNVDLIRNRPWIDLPVRYDNGRRAVIALEKGATGERVIAEAFKGWSAGN